MRALRYLRRAGRLLKYVTITGVAGSTIHYLHKNDWDASSLGVVRFGRAAIVVTKVVIDYKRTLKGLDPNSDQYWQTKSKVHLRSAERLRELCCINKGTFIKVGQHLGALDYLLPTEYVETMKVLHSEAPQSPLEDLYRVIKEDFGKDVEEVFSEFDDKPLGAASLAQVHKAVLKNGTTVAVKVQHLRVKAHAFVDMATMELLVRLVSWIFPDFNLIWLAEETKKNLPRELDFIQEAHNCERVSKVLSHCKFLKIPKVYWEYTTERVMTMEYCTGGQVNNKEYMNQNKISVNDVSQKLGELYSEMIFVQGYIHCDPHPGNIFVEKTKKGLQIVLLDHGLYQTLTDDFRMNYCKFWRSILDTKVEGIKKYSNRMGIGRLYPLFACMVTGRSWDAVSKGVDKKSFTKEEDEQIKENVAAYLPQISDVLSNVPRQMILIFKTNDLLRGIESTLKTRASSSSFVTMSKACVKAVYTHKRHKCSTWTCRFKMTLHEQYYLFKITLYSVYLWMRSTALGNMLVPKKNIRPSDVVKMALS